MNMVGAMSSASILGLFGSLGSAVGGGIAGLLVAVFAIAGILAYVLAHRYLVDIKEMKHRGAPRPSATPRAAPPAPPPLSSRSSIASSPMPARHS